ncbi:hypothetical protein PR048_017720 [Dryococelus australis]|uniref:Uncharacterized protein n=1 Tax=Dryococelus australis TaxID=614101 RepID=A0ABQ9HAD5_9NEOP|nr:hypothetical protein PR048_017720 [Dryococelus australis]
MPINTKIIIKQIDPDPECPALSKSLQKNSLRNTTDTESELPNVDTLASHQCEPGSIPGRVTGFSQVGIVPDDAVGQRIFSGISRFPAPSFRHRSIFTSIKLIGSQDLVVKNRPNLFTHSLYYFEGSKTTSRHLTGRTCSDSRRGRNQMFTCETRGKRYLRIYCFNASPKFINCGRGCPVTDNLSPDYGGRVLDGREIL